MINAILAALAPDLGSVAGGTFPRDHESAVSRIQQALDLISGWPEIPGTNGELFDLDLPLEMLHPVVRQAARPQWKARRFRAAVSDASTAVNGFAQRRLGRHDISGKDLMAQAFTTKEPEPGKNRLRCPGQPKSETWRSQQEGAIAFASGCMQLIRNPAHHMTGDWNPVTAFEHLAALSIVARQTDGWNLDWYIPPIDFSPLTRDEGGSQSAASTLR